MGLYDTVDDEDEELEQTTELDGIPINSRLLELIVINCEIENVLLAVGAGEWEGDNTASVGDITTWTEEELESVGAYLQEELDSESPFGYTAEGYEAKKVEDLVEQIENEVL